MIEAMSKQSLAIVKATSTAAPLGRVRLPLRLYLIALCLFGVLAGGIGFAYKFVRLREILTLHALIAGDAFQIAQSVQNELQDKHWRLQRIRLRAIEGELGRTTSASQLAHRTVSNTRFFEMIAEVDATGRCRWIEPAGENEQLAKADFSQDAAWWNHVDDAIKSEKEQQAGWFVDAHGHHSLGLVIPLSGRRHDPATARVILCKLSPDVIFPDVVPERFRREFNVELRGDTRVMGHIGSVSPQGHPFCEQPMVHWGNHELRVLVAPNDSYLASRMARISKWILWGGIPGSAMISGAFFQMLAYRSRQQSQTERYLASLESLTSISTAISAKLGSGREIMDRLAESALELMRMSVSGVALLEEDGSAMKAYAFAGQVPASPRRLFDLADMPTARRCLASKDVLLIEDLQKITDPQNQEVVVEFTMRSVVLIPLFMQGRCIGMMGLSDPKPRKFTDADRRLARLLGSQASVILANSRLYTQIRRALDLHRQLLEQTRRDAGTKAILLRELHHRVKNNLAGIVGLLSMEGPGLEAEARQWLDRVIERIRTMARAHELFSRGVDQVGLPELVEQVLPSLSVLLLPGMTVRTEIDGVEIKLDTQRAVTLAMVLHELCSNAIIHGLVDKGTLTISAKMSADGVVIEVADDGRGLPSDAEPSRLAGLASVEVSDSGEDRHGEIRHGERWNADAGPSTISLEQGIGLRLVSELVRRELRGNFHLRRRPGGGTIASVELPLGVH
jgi:two-component sensor histidine kinase